MKPGLLKRRQGQHLNNVTPGGSEITATPLSWIEFGFHICRVRELEKARFEKTGRLQEQITFNEARRGSSQISELLR